MEAPIEYPPHFGQVEGHLLQGCPGVVAEVGQRLPAGWGSRGRREAPGGGAAGSAPAASKASRGSLGSQLTVQQDPQDGLEVLGRHLPQREGLAGRVGEQAQEEDHRVLGGEGPQVDVAAGQAGPALPEGGGPRGPGPPPRRRPGPLLPMRDCAPRGQLGTGRWGSKATRPQPGSRQCGNPVGPIPCPPTWPGASAERP